MDVKRYPPSEVHGFSKANVLWILASDYDAKVAELEAERNMREVELAAYKEALEGCKQTRDKYAGFVIDAERELLEARDQLSTSEARALERAINAIQINRR